MYLVKRNMSKTVDVPLLIAEVRKRSALWDFRHGEHKTRHCVPKLWQEVSKIVGVDVEQCKRKWKNLRDAYRAEVRRSERRIERGKLMGVYDPSTNYNSKWLYFPLLTFINETKHENNSYSIDNENTNSNSNENKNYDGTYNESMYDDISFHNNIKLEPNHDMDDDINFVDGDDDDANGMLFEEFQNIATPQAVKRLSATIAMNNSLETSSSKGQLINANISTSQNPSCRCSTRTDEQVNFLQDLGREELKLIKSTRQDICRYNNLDHVGDSDYNFVVSFLPQMKKMSELQNLQFRAKMCELVLNILAPTTAAEDNGVVQEREG